MEYQMPFPTLKRLTLLSIGSYILNRGLSKNKWKPPKHYFTTKKVDRLPREFRDWSLFTSEASLVLGHVQLPELIKSQIMNVLLQLQIKISEWLAFCECEELGFKRRAPGIKMFNHMYFTVHGEIDRTKMFETYIEKFLENARTLVHLYQLACEFCLPGHVSSICERMSSSELYKVHSTHREDLLFQYWFSTIDKSIVSKKTQSRKWQSMSMTPVSLADLMDFAVENRRKVAVWHFWDKLPEDVKRSKAAKCAMFAIEQNITDLMCKALSYMDNDEQRQLFRRKAYLILESLLLWPYEDFFLETLEYTWEFISTGAYVSLFGHIVLKVLKSRQCHKIPSSDSLQSQFGSVQGHKSPRSIRLPDWFKNLLHEFWFRCPIALRHLVLEDRLEIKKFCTYIRKLEAHEVYDIFKLITEDIKQIGNGGYKVARPRRRVCCLRHSTR